MSRAAGPRVPAMAANGAGVWVILLIGWSLAAGAWLAWLAARIAATLTGRRVPPFGEHWIISLARGRTDQTWPGTPTGLVLLIGVALTGTAVTAGALTWRVIAARIPRPGDPVAALAANPQIRPLTPIPAAKTAIRLRPSLAGAGPRVLPAGDTGLLLGDLQRPAGRGTALYASWEDTICAFMAPRSGKTTALSIPYVLAAPGAVVATSNKTDLWAATAQLRAGSGSTVWLFDPQRITGAGQAWWWNPLAGLATVEAAHRIASHFVLTIDDSSRRDLWGPAAQDLLCAVFLAAASSGRSLRECGRWLADAGSPIPAELLDTAGFHALAASLRGTQHGAPETRDGIYQTARTAAKCLNDEDIMRWVTPSPPAARHRDARAARPPCPRATHDSEPAVRSLSTTAATAAIPRAYRPGLNTRTTSQSPSRPRLWLSCGQSPAEAASATGQLISKPRIQIPRRHETA
jgi:Type IV secretory system Conjugative DNA transfer